MRESQKKEDTVGRNARKVANRGVFRMICGSGGWKSRLANKAAGAEPCGQSRYTKRYDALARSAFPSQNVQNTLASDTF